VRVQGSLRDKERRDAELAREVVRARLESLTFRLQPHFLFNALNTISSTLFKDPVAADLMISNLGDLLRHALRTGEQQEVTVAEELDVLRAYVAIIDARFGDRLKCVVDADDDVSALAIPALLLQPLVENAVRHGSASERSGSEIRVAVSRRDGEVHVLVENDVADGAVEARRAGTGLRATVERLRLLYGEAQHFSARAEGGRFRVDIRYPARAPSAVASRAPDEYAAAARAHR
jgi:two-component system, LytTR family, sensor kinase